MELKPGYKQTEVGVIPEDWAVESAKNLCVKIQDGTHFSPRIGGNDFFYITSKNIRFGFLDLTTADRIDENQHRKIYKRCDVRQGDVLLTKDGANTGNAALNTLDDEFSLLSSVAFLRFDNARYDARYFLQQILSSDGQKQIQDAMSGNAITRLTLEKINKLKFAHPTTKAEQQAIAEALSDADALIESLEQLIAKKRQIKQGAMQELLTGKRRLPGFGGEWEKRALGSEVIGLDTGVSVNSLDEEDSFAANEPVILKTSCLSGGTFLAHECKRIIAKDVSRAKLTPERDSILISRMNTIDLVGECGYVSKDYPNVYVPDRLWITRFRNRAEISPKWLSYILSSYQYRIILKGIATGTSGSMKNIAKPVFLAIPVIFPTKDEQTAITEILTDMDTEINTLETKLTKARQLKQGMMQELLTGKTRLVQPKEAANA